MESIKEMVAEQIYHLLSTQSFADWYEEKFIPHIENGDDAPTKEDILKWLSSNI